jgi:integrase
VLSSADKIDVVTAKNMSELSIIKHTYGSGLRLSEALSLRVKDIDFAQSQIVVRECLCLNRWGAS